MYEKILTKEKAPKFQSLIDDIRDNKDPDFFRPTGTQVYCGRQGAGKTASAVYHTYRLKQRYPKSIIVSNLRLNYMRGLSFTSTEELAKILNSSKFDPTKYYIKFQTTEELHIVLTKINNGFFGVIYIIDEIHTYFNALNSKNTPMFVFTEISQQRKQRKCIIGTSQIFMRMEKALREQCDNLIMCNTILGFWTFQKAYDGMTLQQEYDGSLIGKVKKVGWFFHTRKTRELYDTYQKVISSELQYEQTQRLEIKQPRKLLNIKGR